MSNIHSITDGKRLDTLTITASQWLELADTVRDGLAFRSIKTTDLKTLEALDRRILELITVNSLNYAPTKLGNLNRRFGVIAKRYSTTTADLVEAYIVAGTVQTLEARGITLLYSKRIWSEQTAMYIAEGFDFETADTKPDLEVYTARLLKNSK